jgi:hypothetical protein
MNATAMPISVHFIQPGSEVGRLWAKVGSFGRRLS